MYTRLLFYEKASGGDLTRESTMTTMMMKMMMMMMISGAEKEGR